MINSGHLIVASICSAGVIALVVGFLIRFENYFIKKLKSHFVQGEHNKRHELLKAIAEIIYDEYREDNFYSRFTWLVEELLISDPAFQGLYDKKTTSEYLKKGLAQAVDEATKRLEKTK